MACCISESGLVPFNLEVLYVGQDVGQDVGHWFTYSIPVLVALFSLAYNSIHAAQHFAVHLIIEAEGLDLESEMGSLSGEESGNCSNIPGRMNSQHVAGKPETRAVITLWFVVKIRSYGFISN